MAMFRVGTIGTLYHTGNSQETPAIHLLPGDAYDSFIIPG